MVTLAAWHTWLPADADLDVFLLGWKEHPHVCEEAGKPEGGVHWADDAGQAAIARDSVCLADPSLRLWPVLDAACRDVAVKCIGGKWQVLCVPLQQQH